MSENSNQSYLITQGETPEQYVQRLQAMEKPNKLLQRAGIIIGKAFQFGVYTVDEVENRDPVNSAFDALMKALIFYEGRQDFAKLAGVPEAIAARVQEHATGRFADRAEAISSEMVEKVMQNVASEQAAGILQKGLDETWRLLKEVHDLPELNTSAKRVIGAFKDNGKHTEVSRLVEDISKLREDCRNMTSPHKK